MSLSAARDKALDDARRKAVEQAVGAVISSSTVTENFELLEDKIFSQAAGYVRSYVVVDESRDADGIYSVTIDCEVSAGKIDSDLAAIQNLLAQKQMPRVLVMVSEQNVGQTEGVDGGPKRVRQSRLTLWIILFSQFGARKA